MRKLLFILSLLALGCSCSRDAAMYEPVSEQDAEYKRLVDSLSSALDYEIEFAPLDSVLSAMRQYYASGNTLRHYWMQAQSEYFMGLSKWRSNKGNDAVADFLNALRILDAHFDDRNPDVSLLYGKIHLRVSWIMYGFGQYPLSKKLAKCSLDYAFRSNDTSLMIRCCSHLTSAYERLGKPSFEEKDTACYYAKKGFAIADAKRYPKETAKLFAEYGNVCRHSCDLDSALLFFKKAVEIAPEKSGIYYETQNYMAFVYYVERKYDTAIVCLKEGLNSEDEVTRCVSAYGLADCYMQLGDTVSAAPYLAIANEDHTQNALNRRTKSDFVEDFTICLQEKEARESSWTGGKWLLVGLTVIVLAVLALALRKKKTEKPVETEPAAEPDATELCLQAKARFAETAIYGTIIGRCLRKLSPDDLLWQKMQLSATEWDDLMQAIDQCFPKFRSILRDVYGMNSQAEVEYCLLSLFETSDANRAGLMGLSYQGIRSRRNRVIETLQCDSKSFSAVLDDILKQSFAE